MTYALDSLSEKEVGPARIGVQAEHELSCWIGLGVGWREV